MNQSPAHATYKKTVVNTFTISNEKNNNSNNDSVNARIQNWTDFIDHGIIDRRNKIEDMNDLPETVCDFHTSSNGKENNNEDTEKTIKRHAANYVLTYLPEVNVGPMRVSLKLDSSRLPSFCAGFPSSSPPPLVSLTSKMHELSIFETERRAKTAKTAASASTGLRHLPGASDIILIDVPNVVARAIKCLQYAHMSRLIHGRVCCDAFYVSSFENPFIPTLCLGELPLLPQFFVNLGAELGNMRDEEAKNREAADAGNSTATPAQQHMAKSAINQPQQSSWWRVLAPEILRKEPYDASADVWGIGVLTVQLCMASVGLPASTWTSVETKDLREATIVSPILRGLPPAAVSFATMCLKGNPSHRPTLAGLLNHPWLKMMTRGEDGEELEKKFLAPKQQPPKQQEASAPEKKLDGDPSPLTLPSNSAFQAELDPRKVDAVLATLAKMKQQRDLILASTKSKSSNNTDDQNGDSGNADDDDDDDDDNSLENGDKNQDDDDDDDEEESTSSNESDDEDEDEEDDDDEE